MDQSLQPKPMTSANGNGLSSEPGRPAPGDRFLWWPVLVFVLICAAEFAWITSFDEGHFVFSMDDPYIHLTLARNILHGHYGLLPGQAAAPASSILWPFLTAPLTLLPNPPLAVLALNLVIGACSVWLTGWILRRSLQPAPSHRGQAALLSLTTILLMVAFNQIGLVFTGMEHSLQVLCCLVILTGLIEERSTGRAAGWLLTALVAAPLIRYECMGIVLPSLVYLWARGHRRPVLIAAAILFALLALFSVFLLSLGLSYLPTSVRAKSSFLHSGLAILPAMLSNPGFYLLRRTMLIGIVLIGVRIWRLPAHHHERWLGLIGIAGLLFHAALGEIDPFNRYVIYCVAFAYLLLVYLYRDGLSRGLKARGAWPFLLVVLLVMPLLFRHHASLLWNTPLGSRNIYNEQVQMTRFVRDYYRQPVGVNDIGYLAYAGGQPFVDFWGLTSLEALRHRLAVEDTQWMSWMALRNNVHLAMIYPDWFGDLPENWILLGQLFFAGKSVSAYASSVDFYALDQQTADRVRPLLAAFRKTLPPGVYFKFSPPPPPGGAPPQGR